MKTANYCRRGQRLLLALHAAERVTCGWRREAVALRVHRINAQSEAGVRCVLA